MTINPEKIQGLMQTLRQYLIHLHNLANLGREEVLSDPYKRGAA